MSAFEMALKVYQVLTTRITEFGIPIELNAPSLVGTVQDDPFDTWIESYLITHLPDEIEITHAGSLTTPDLVLRDKSTGDILGLEIKKLIQQPNGKDPRGLTIDYNSCLPCGSTMIKVGNDTQIIPCFYLFALLDTSSTHIVTTILLDGDFLNFDFDLHKESKYSNYTEYNHGPFGEGSVRHRKMYTYPNPLNSKIEAFRMRHTLVAKKKSFDNSHRENIQEEVIRTDKFGNSYYFSLYDKSSSLRRKENQLTTLTGIFDACKKRKAKNRTAYMVTLPILGSGR